MLYATFEKTTSNRWVLALDEELQGQYLGGRKEALRLVRQYRQDEAPFMGQTQLERLCACAIPEKSKKLAKKRQMTFFSFTFPLI